MLYAEISEERLHLSSTPNSVNLSPQLRPGLLDVPFLRFVNSNPPLKVIDKAPGHFVPLKSEVGVAKFPRVKSIQEIVPSFKDNYLEQKLKTSLELANEYQDALPFLGIRTACMRIKA